MATNEALEALCTSIPNWNQRLDELNGQIAERQIELAKLTEDRPPSARSARNKGSTESLRPRDQNESSFDLEATETRPTPVPTKEKPAPVSPPRTANSNPRASPNALARQSSQPTPYTAPSPVARKRKPESAASSESLMPKYKTRRMIIVYYDSMVQTAFEELVKFVSASRNAMRKGKMAAKMASMRRAAEIEVGGDDSEAEGKGNPSLHAAQKRVVDGMEEADGSQPKLRFMSSRTQGAPPGPSPFGLGMMGYRRSADGNDIFDQLEKGLEWCQSRCELAAHQFLREGECTTEIEEIKKRLSEVRDSAAKELSRLEQEPVSVLGTAGPRRHMNLPEDGKARQLKSVHIRRDHDPPKTLEVDHNEMEVDDDDEGVDVQNTPLVFKRSKDIIR